MVPKSGNRFSDKTMHKLNKLFLDRVDAVWIERQPLGNLRHCRKRLLVAPDRIFRALVADADRVVRRIALVGAMGRMAAALERGHVGILARNVEHRLVAGFAQRQRARGVGDGAAVEHDAHTLRMRLDRDRMVGTGKFHRTNSMNGSALCGRPPPAAQSTLRDDRYASTCRSMSRTRLTPHSAMVTSSSLRMMSIAFDTPACPPAPSP